jgi:LysR family nitrogen assimilation transcriptional regulator
MKMTKAFQIAKPVRTSGNSERNRKRAGRTGIMHSQHLEYFCKVAEYGSFSRAAIVLGINQSALSRHIRNLETDLGLPLFYRNGRGAILTEHGKRLLTRAMKALEEIALAKQEALNARGEAVESVVIGLPPTVARVLVRPLAAQLTRIFPKIRLRFAEGFSGHLLEWLDSGRVDIAVMYSGWAAGRLHAEQLINERLCLVASNDARKLKATTPTSDLARLPLILPSAPHGMRRLVDLVAVDLKLPLNVVIEADSFGSILALVKANLGYSLLPTTAIQDELARQEFQASLLVEPEVIRTLILATPNNRPTVEGLGQIAKAIKKELRQIEAMCGMPPVAEVA